MNFVSLSPFFFPSLLLVTVRPAGVRQTTFRTWSRFFFFSSLRFVFCSFHPFLEFRLGTRQLFATSFIIVSYFFFFLPSGERRKHVHSREQEKESHKNQLRFFLFIYLFCPTSKKLPGLLVKRNKR